MRLASENLENRVIQHNINNCRTVMYCSLCEILIRNLYYNCPYCHRECKYISANHCKFCDGKWIVKLV